LRKLISALSAVFHLRPIFAHFLFGMPAENVVENVHGMRSRMVDEKHVQNLSKNTGKYAESPRISMLKSLWKT